MIAIIGAKTFSQEIKAHIGRSLTEKWGGCFIGEGSGFWSSEGNIYQEYYGANSIVEEVSLRIEVTVLPNSEQAAVASIQKAMNEIKDGNSIFIRFVHIEKSHALSITWILGLGFGQEVKIEGSCIA